MDRVSCLSDYYNYRVACQLDNHVIPVEKNINDTTIVIFEDVYPYTQYTCYVKVYDDNDTLQYNDTSHITGQTLPGKTYHNSKGAMCNFYTFHICSGSNPTTDATCKPIELLRNSFMESSTISKWNKFKLFSKLQC